LGAPRRPPEVKAEEATPHQKYWLANGMEVRPFRWDPSTESVMCSREISPGHRKRDYPVKFGTTLFTTPPLKVEKPAAGEEQFDTSAARTVRLDCTKPNLSGPLSPEFREELQVPTAGAALPPVQANAAPDDAMGRMMALHALREAMTAALSENTSRKWQYFLIACRLNPQLRATKSILVQAELDARAVDAQSTEIMNAAKKL